MWNNVNSCLDAVIETTFSCLRLAISSIADPPSNPLRPDVHVGVVGEHELHYHAGKETFQHLQAQGTLRRVV